MGPSRMLFAFLLGAAAVGVAWFLVGADTSRSPADLADDPLGATALHASDASEARLARIERRLDALLAATGVRTAGPAEGPELAARGVEASDESESGEGAELPVITDEVLDRTLERMEERRLARMTPEQLRAAAHRQIKEQKDMQAARALLTRVLARELEADFRAQVLTDLGSVERELGEYEASERALREAMSTAGMDTETGVKAGYNLVWTFRRAERTDRALALADELIANRTAPETLRPWLRWAGARMAFDHGDRERARQDYRALLGEVQGNSQYRQIAKDAEERLRELEVGPR
ncbi:MAG: hypothetical protein O2894_09310 [Planctomycetota bacterium]|nr:hypothetical protein [Planctomycetota bacterium]